MRNHKLAQQLVETCKREANLIAEVLACLPEPVRTHCRQVALSEGRLRVILDSPAWLTRARFLEENLFKALAGHGVIEVRFVADPKGANKQMPREGGFTVPKHRLAASVVSHLLDAADHLEDPALRSVFRRFALRHAAPPSGNKS